MKQRICAAILALCLLWDYCLRRHWRQRTSGERSTHRLHPKGGLPGREPRRGLPPVCSTGEASYVRELRRNRK